MLVNYVAGTNWMMCWMSLPEFHIINSALLFCYCHCITLTWVDEIEIKSAFNLDSNWKISKVSLKRLRIGSRFVSVLTNWLFENANIAFGLWIKSVQVSETLSSCLTHVLHLSFPFSHIFILINWWDLPPFCFGYFPWNKL